MSHPVIWLFALSICLTLSVLVPGFVWFLARRRIDRAMTRAEYRLEQLQRHLLLLEQIPDPAIPPYEGPQS